MRIFIKYELTVTNPAERAQWPFLAPNLFRAYIDVVIVMEAGKLAPAERPT